MKKLIVLSFVFLSIMSCSKKAENACGVLPQGVNYKLVLNESIYILTDQGLRAEGLFMDSEVWDGSIQGEVLKKKQKTIYLEAFMSSSRSIPDGIYKVDLAKLPLFPIMLPGTDKGQKPTVSPDGSYLTFYLRNPEYSSLNYDLVLMDLRSKKIKYSLNDGYYVTLPRWINDHQFIYYSFDKNLYLYDIHTREKEDLHMPGYAPGDIMPGGKRILLSGEGKTVIYNIGERKVEETIMGKSIDAASTIWMPDGKGFIYYTFSWKDVTSIIAADSVGGIAYYSVDKKKEVRLIRKMSLEGGFVVPSDIELNPVDNEHNRRYLKFINEKNSNGIQKICAGKKK